MALWLLLKKPDETGATIPLTPARNVITYGAAQYSFDISLKPDNDDDLYRSGKHGGQQGFALLWREGYVRQSVTARFELNVPLNVHGNSADLLFALAVVTQMMPNRETDYPPIAATGCLNEKGRVEGVQGVSGKLRAALATLPAGGIVFYPLSNHIDVDLALRQQAAACQITLYPIERLDQAVERLGIAINKVYSKSPYRGLEAFHAKHRSIYFGRQAEIEALTTQLLEREQKQTTGVLIIAASGTGKSSLVQAGLVPALQQGRLALQDKRLFSTVWQPSDIDETINESSLVQSLITNWQKLAELLALDFITIQTLEHLSLALAKTLPTHQRFVWVLNQMEELFTLDFSEALLKTFCEFLRYLQKMGVWVIATLRNDFYDRYQAQPALLKMFGSSGVYDLPALDVAALRQIIEEPAHLADVRFEINNQGISLATRLLNDMAGNTEALPLLEFILQELHAARIEGVMTYQHYNEMNGLMGSIGHRAETVFLGLDEQIQATLPCLLWKLAAKAKDDARKQIVAQAVYLNDFAENNPIRYLITAFIEQRLLIQDNENQQAIKVRVVHEALLTHWLRANKIINDFIADKQLHDQLQNQAQDWYAAPENQKKAFLIVAGEPLIRAEGLLNRRGSELLSPDLLALIQASVVHRHAWLAKQKNESRLKKGIVVVMFLVVSSSATFAWMQKVEAEQEAQRAERYFRISDKIISEINAKLSNIPQTSEIIIDVLNKIIIALDETSKLDADDEDIKIIKANMVIKIGDIYFNSRGDYKKSLDYYEKSYDILLKIVSKNSTKNLNIELSNSLSRQGNCYKKLNDINKAGNFYNKALFIREQVAKQNPEDKQAQLALSDIFSRIGDIDITRLNKIDDAFKMYQRALKIRQKMAQQYPDDKEVKLFLATTTMNNGDIYLIDLLPNLSN